MRIIVFQIGTEYFGVEINRVKEIVAREGVIESSNMNSQSVVGILNLHGDMIPVLDLHKIFRIRPLNTQDSAYFMILYLEKGRLALPIDKVEKYLDVLPQNLKPVPSFVLGAKVRYFNGAARADGRLFLMFDPESFAEYIKGGRAQDD